MVLHKEKQRMGKDNGRWAGGKSSDFRRRVTKAKPGELVHHKDGNKGNNSKSNFKVLKPKGNVTAIGMHNKHHDRRNNTLIKKCD